MPQPTPVPTPEPTQAPSRVVIESTGGEIPCNRASFFIDGQQVVMDDGSATGHRGINVVVIEPESQWVVSAKYYDLWGDTTNQNNRLADDLMQLPPGKSPRCTEGRRHGEATKFGP